MMKNTSKMKYQIIVRDENSSLVIDMPKNVIEKLKLLSKYDEKVEKDFCRTLLKTIIISLDALLHNDDCIKLLQEKEDGKKN